MSSPDDEHPPLQDDPTRIGPDAYDSAFLESLKANGQVRAVGEHWDGDSSKFAPHVTHVIYPNGDLQRIGMA